MYLLACLVHKANPDVNSDPTKTRSGSTRKEMKEREAEERTAAAKDKPSSTTVQGKASEEMFLAKAEMMKQNATLGNIELVEKQLTLLERFKPSFVKVQASKGRNGVLEYDKTATSLLEELRESNSIDEAYKTNINHHWTRR